MYLCRNPYFIGINSAIEELRNDILELEVAILILLELTLQYLMTTIQDNCFYVAILILLELTLQFGVERGLSNVERVAILILLELTLQLKN